MVRRSRERGEDFSNGLIAAEGCRGRSTEEEEEEGGGLSDGGSGGRGERRGGRHISGERRKRRYVREAVGIAGGLPCARMPIAGHGSPLQEEACRLDELGFAGVAPRARGSDGGSTGSDRTEIN